MNRVTPEGTAIIVKWLTRYCEVFRKEMTQNLFEAYRDCLYDLTEPELELGFTEALRRSRFFPNPGDVRDALDVALERMPRRRESDPECKICAGNGWKIVERDGRRWAATCDCRKRNTA